MNEHQLKRRIQIITAVAVCVLAALILTLIGQWMSLIQLRSNQAALQAELDKLDQTATGIEAEIAYKESEQYVEQYAREELGMTKPDEDKFVVE